LGYNTDIQRFGVRAPYNPLLGADALTELAPMYWGASSTVTTTEGQVRALANAPQTYSFRRIISLTAVNQYLCAAGPAVWGTPNVRFVDGGQPIAMDWTQFTVGGVSHNVGNSHSPMTINSLQVELY
jgi:hypothetical protein